MSDTTKIPVGQPGPPEAAAAEAGGDEALLEKLREWSASTATHKLNHPTLERLGRNLGLDVEGKTKEVIAQTIKDHLDQPDGIDEIEAEYAPPAIEKPDFSEEGAGKPQWVLNCAKCGEVALKFQPGFDPKNPVVRGAVKPVHLWPFKFVGWPHQDDDALQHRSRENLKCPRCESRLPLAGSGKQVRSQYLRRIS